MHPPDAVVAEVARRQHGVVTVAQLAAVGIHRRGIAHRVAHGRLTPLHRGVYRVGPLGDELSGVMAAVLACGPTAVASHRTAARLHGFWDWRGVTDVTATEGQPRSRPGITVHRRRVEEGERTSVRGIPVTTPERTIRDLAPVVGETHLGRVIEEAQVQRKLDDASLTRAVSQARGQRGVRALRAAAPQAEAALTRSEAERRLVKLVRRSGLPRPQTNVRLAGHEVDALWPREGLVVEVDGFAFHGGRRAFERDRRRDADLLAAGHRVLRLTWRQLADEPEAVVARIAAALAVSRR